jgi:hypothetical protein
VLLVLCDFIWKKIIKCKSFVKKEQKISLGVQQSEFFLFTTKAETEAHPNHFNNVAFSKFFGSNT